MVSWQFDDQERVNIGIDIGWSEKKKSCALAVEGLILPTQTPSWTSYPGKRRPVAVGLFRFSELLGILGNLIRFLSPTRTITAVLDGPLGRGERPLVNRRVDGEFAKEPFRGRMQPSPVGTGDGRVYSNVTDRLARTLYAAANLEYRAGCWDGYPVAKLVCCETHPTVGLALLLPPQGVDTLPSRKQPRRLTQAGTWIRAKSDWYWQLGAGNWIAEELACPAIAKVTHHERVAGLYCLGVAKRLSTHQPDMPTVAAIGDQDGTYLVPSVVDRGWENGLRRVGIHVGELLPQDQSRFVVAVSMPPVVASSESTDTGLQRTDFDTIEKGDAATLILTDNGGIWEAHNDWLVGMTSPVYVRTEDGHKQIVEIEKANGSGQWRVEISEHRPKQLASLRGFRASHLSRDNAWAIPITIIDCPRCH